MLCNAEMLHCNINSLSAALPELRLQCCRSRSKANFEGLNRFTFLQRASEFHSARRIACCFQGGKKRVRNTKLGSDASRERRELSCALDKNKLKARC